MTQVKYVQYVNIQEMSNYAKRVLSGKVKRLAYRRYPFYVKLSEYASSQTNDDSLKYVKFEDFGYAAYDENGLKNSSMLETYDYVKFVYENLPDSMKKQYAKDWNQLYASSIKIKNARAIKASGKAREFILPPSDEQTR